MPRKRVLKKPQSLNVLGICVPIEYRNALPNCDVGFFESDPLKISVVEDANWKAHLIHEAFHCILHLSGHSEGLSKKQEEGLVRALELGVITILGGLA